jgi:hypothetical protein
MIPCVRLPLAASALLVAGCLAGKGRPQAAQDPKPAAAGPELIGRIASIPPDRRFVLIQGYHKRNYEPGTILTTRGLENRNANLLVTGEALGQFAAADIQSGHVEIGDAVYLNRTPQQPETAANPENPGQTTGNESITPKEIVQKNN